MRSNSRAKTLLKEESEEAPFEEIVGEQGSPEGVVSPHGAGADTTVLLLGRRHGRNCSRGRCTGEDRRTGAGRDCTTSRRDYRERMVRPSAVAFTGHCRKDGRLNSRTRCSVLANRRSALELQSNCARFRT